MTNFRLFQTEGADGNFRFGENGGKFCKKVEKTMSNFSFSHSVFNRVVL